MPESEPALLSVLSGRYAMIDFWGRMTTPLGYLQVAQKIGGNAPLGAVFHNRRFTGEVIRANAPGRDPITTRIIWLRFNLIAGVDLTTFLSQMGITDPLLKPKPTIRINL